jgi:hypothetical protein
MKVLMLLATLANPECPVSQYEETASTASAHLQEEAEINHVPESEIGAYLVLWNKASCDKLNTNESGWPDDERKNLENSCTQIVHLKKAPEAEYVAGSQTHISNSIADFATLVWAEKSGLFGKTKHTVLVADHRGTLKLTFAGYGRDGRIDRVCEPALWTFPKPTSG